jgi:hypothetical protein
LPVITARHVDNAGFFFMHKVQMMFSQVTGPKAVRAAATIPSISPACPQACCLFAQVIHRFVHRKAGKVVAGLGQRQPERR